MSEIFFQTTATHKGTPLIINETYKPASLGHMMNQQRTDKTNQDLMEMATGFCDNGNVRLQMQGLKTPSGYTFSIETDLANNPTVARDANIAAAMCRWAAFFGISMASEANAPVAEGEERVPNVPQEAASSSLPPPSLLGDFVRLVGGIIGIVIDYIMLGIWTGCTATANAFRRLVAAAA